mmetsp:Transcript_37484/g.57415  ORF Transcript_37484/g.57415 Transcript_37484/m.57415 type:complete len:110 (+) Transcript_37484:872-1201(+)
MLAEEEKKNEEGSVLFRKLNSSSQRGNMSHPPLKDYASEMFPIKAGRQLLSGGNQSQKRQSEDGEDMADVCADPNLSIDTNNTPNLIKKYDTTNSKSMASIPGSHMTLS